MRIHLQAKARTAAWCALLTVTIGAALPHARCIREGTADQAGATSVVEGWQWSCSLAGQDWTRCSDWNAASIRACFS